MVNLNKVLLVGNLTKDPELRYTPQGSAVVTLRLAVNRTFKDKSGQAQRDTCFVNVVVWGQMAEVCNQYLQKGRQVFVEGRLQSRSWQNNEGKTRSVIEVVASRVQFMPQSGTQGGSQGAPAGARVASAQDGIDLGQEPQEAFEVPLSGTQSDTQGGTPQPAAEETEETGEAI
jgi:single-strand DNA-binding protein